MWQDFYQYCDVVAQRRSEATEMTSNGRSNPFGWGFIWVSLKTEYKMVPLKSELFYKPHWLYVHSIYI